MESLNLMLPADGSVVSLLSEDFPLKFLGDMRVDRISEIVFIEATQTFSVFHILGPLLSAGHDTYSAAVGWERQWYSECVDAGIDPRLKQSAEDSRQQGIL